MKYLEKPIHCSCCGRTIEIVPKQALFYEEEPWRVGWFWSCRCGVVLFAPVDEVYQLKDQAS